MHTKLPMTSISHYHQRWITRVIKKFGITDPSTLHLTKTPLTLMADGRSLTSCTLMKRKGLGQIPSQEIRNLDLAKVSSKPGMINIVKKNNSQIVV